MRWIMTGLWVLVWAGCGGDGGGGTTPAPCGGICPPSSCFAGTCVGGDVGNNGADVDPDGGGDAGDADDADDADDSDVPDVGDTGDTDNPDAPDTADLGDTADAPDDAPDLPEGCVTDADCDDGEVCEEEVCLTACVLDALEPNDDADADPVVVRAGRRLVIDELTACDGDVDWYPVALDEAREQLTVSLVQGDGPALQVDILDTDATTVLDTAPDADPPRRAGVVAAAPGTYFVRVTAPSDVATGGVGYELTLTRTAPDGCVPDDFEPNESAGDAATVDSGESEGRLCRHDGDADWYAFAVALGDEVDLALRYDHAAVAPNADLGALVYGPGGEADVRDFLVRDGNTDTDRLAGGAFTAGRTDEGTWLVEVSTLNDGDPVDYTVDLRVEGRAQMCDVVDPNEPNNSCGAAAMLPTFTSVDGYMCGPASDEDWFAVTVGDGQELTVTVEHFHFEGNLELEVYDPDEALADLSYNAGPDLEEVVIEDARPGRYCIRIFANSELTENSYTVAAETR